MSGCPIVPDCTLAAHAYQETPVTAYNDRSAASDDVFQREVLERFDAPVPPADSELREELAIALWQCDVADEAPAHRVLELWPKVCEKFPADAAAYRERADAALAVFAAHHSQQQAAIDRVEALADELDGYYADHDSVEDIEREQAFADAADRVRVALGSDL